MGNSMRVFYSEKDGNAVDVVHPETGKGAYSGQTLEQLTAQYGELVQIDSKEAGRRSDQKHITAPEVTDADYFDQMLNVLPPMNWHRSGCDETFQLCERYSGRVTLTLVKLGHRYFKFYDIEFTPYLTLIAKAYTAAKALDAAQAEAAKTEAG